MGDDRFIEAALAQAEEPAQRYQSLETIIEAICSAYGLTKAELASRTRVRQISEARAVVALLVREAEMLTMVDLGKEIKQDVSSLSQAARRLELRVGSDSRLRGQLETIQRRVVGMSNNQD